MTVLVTGATGLVGNNVVRQLVERGERVKTLVRKSSNPQSLESLPIERVTGDVTDRASVDKAMRDVRAVVHAAALVHIGWTRKQESWRVNVEGTTNVAAAALQAGARMLYVSSVDAAGIGSLDHPADESTPYHPHTPCPYPVTKREGELVVQRYIQDGLDAIIAAPGFMLGPWDWKPSSGRLVVEVVQRKPLFAPRATNDFTHVADVAAAMITALDQSPTGSKYLLTGNCHTYLEVFRTIAKQAGVRQAIAAVGPGILYPLAWSFDLAAKLGAKESDINSAAIRLTREPRYYSHEKATKELDYNPRPLPQAVEDTLAWMREYSKL